MEAQKAPYSNCCTQITHKSAKKKRQNCKCWNTQITHKSAKKKRQNCKCWNNSLQQRIVSLISSYKHQTTMTVHIDSQHVEVNLIPYIAWRPAKFSLKVYVKHADFSCVDLGHNGLLLAPTVLATNCYVLAMGKLRETGVNLVLSQVQFATLRDSWELKSRPHWRRSRRQ